MPLRAFAAYIIGMEFCAAPTARNLFCITAKGTSHSGPADVDGAPLIDFFKRFCFSFIVPLIFLWENGRSQDF